GERGLDIDSSRSMIPFPCIKAVGMVNRLIRDGVASVQFHAAISRPPRLHVIARSEWVSGRKTRYCRLASIAPEATDATKRRIVACFATDHVPHSSGSAQPQKRPATPLP